MTSPTTFTDPSATTNLLTASHRLFIQFPYAALTTARQRPFPEDEEDSERDPSADMQGPTLSPSLVRLLTTTESVSSLLAKEPGFSPGEAWERLFGDLATKPEDEEQEEKSKISEEKGELKAAGKGRFRIEDRLTTGGVLCKEEREKTLRCGRWGPKEPGELFLTIYHDAVGPLQCDPALGMVSPGLMGSSGTIPLTVISTVPDIVRHMSNLIVRAELEVVLATNYWQNGVAAKFITNAMKELSRRAGERGTRIVMKIIYDRGSPKQLFEPHYLVSEKEWTGDAVGLPFKHEIPNIDLQVMNYHHPMLGTFHAKYMVVDRKMAVLQSNNIQDNDNLEMMVHLEGPIVDSLYDMALLSWQKKLDPPLPTCTITPAEAKPKAAAAVAAVNRKAGEPQSADAARAGNGEDVEEGEEQKTEEDMAVLAEGVRSIHQAGEPSSGHRAIDAFLREGSSGKQAFGRGSRQPPLGAGASLPQEHTTDDPRYDTDLAAETRRVQASVSPKLNGDGDGEGRVDAVCRHLNHTTNVGFKADATSADVCGREGEEMTPYVLSDTRGGDFPIAMVCRSPHGAPNHNAVYTPQNVAWLSALRNARESVLIQSPTLNAEPLVPAIREACERGVDVFCYVCLGYNDAGELLPMQGGHNEMVARDLHSSLSPAGRSHLHYFWYVAKDQTKPIVQARHKRSCHVKLMIVDSRVGIVGNGNQDTQSWFHSQEINVMIDSPDMCAAWIDALRRNQNTHVYGALDREMGVWRDVDGNEAEGAIGVDPGRFSWMRGVAGAVKRLKGTGGF